jgi:hypothetical protein
MATEWQRRDIQRYTDPTTANAIGKETISAQYPKDSLVPFKTAWLIRIPPWIMILDYENG